MYKPKLSVILGNVGHCGDRYCPQYSDPFTLEELFDRVNSIEGVEGVEMVSNWHITWENLDEVKGHLERTGLKPVSIIPDHFGEAKWGKIDGKRDWCRKLWRYNRLWSCYGGL